MKDKLLSKIGFSGLLPDGVAKERCIVIRCPNCQEKIPETASFCPKCGSMIASCPGEHEELRDAASESSDEGLYSVALNMVSTVSQLPVIRVDRDEFLAKQFASSPHLEQIVSLGPQTVFTPESLRKVADRIINESTTKTAAASFLSGLPSNPVTMVAAGGADVVQYFGFAINLAQRLAYLFGEDALFTEGATDMSEQSKIRVIAYLGTMFGAAGAAQLIAKTSVKVGTNLGKQVAAKALTKTMWYPVLKKAGALVGQKITKKTVEKTITKAVPIVGGVVSGALTLVTFRPMGARLADVFAENLKTGVVAGDDLELNMTFLEQERVTTDA